MNNPFTKHPNDTTNPQGYWKHGVFAFKNSAIVAWAGVLGMTHAVFPFVFPFNTSTTVIKSFKKIIDSGRHKEELNKIMPEGYVYKKHLK